MKFEIHTYGCKVNTYDSGLLENRLRRSGFDRGEQHVHILNTCAVTAEATNEAIRTARRLKAKDPQSLIVVTGCAAQVDTERIADAAGVDLVIANSHKGQLETLLRDHRAGSTDRVYKSNIFKKEDLEPGGGLEDAHTRSFLKIQDGCNSFCTFCVIPFARGKSRSLTIEDILRRARELESRGVREVVLTGVHIADYRDGERGLEDLVEALLMRTQNLRLRLTSLEPGEVSERLLELFSDQRMCPHFHMSIQSATNPVLLAMKRQYTAQAVETSLEAIAAKVPRVFVGMDVIAGFPTESDADFVDSIERLKRLPWSQLHVFPYSPRPGTYAARQVDGVGGVARKLRARLLRELSRDRLERLAQTQVGKIKRGLGLNNGRLLSDDYWTLISDQPVEANAEVDLEITGSLGGTKLSARAVACL